MIEISTQDFSNQMCTKNINTFLLYFQKILGRLYFKVRTKACLLQSSEKLEECEQTAQTSYKL